MHGDDTCPIAALSTDLSNDRKSFRESLRAVPVTVEGGGLDDGDDDDEDGDVDDGDNNDAHGDNDDEDDSDDTHDADDEK